MDAAEVLRLGSQVCSRYGLRAEDREDALLELLLRWERYGRSCSLRWLAMCARSCAVEVIRRERRHWVGRELRGDVAVDGGISSVEVGIDLRRALWSLNRVDRLAVLCAAMGMTEEEGSRALGLTRQRYKGALQRARRRLARELGDGWL